LHDGTKVTSSQKPSSIRRRNLTDPIVGTCFQPKWIHWSVDVRITRRTDVFRDDT
jgi:hypothetical protein